MARTFNVSFNINGSLDGSLQAALANAANAMRGLGNAARAASASARASQAGLRGMANSLNALQNAAQKFRDLKKAVGDTQSALNAAQSNANALAAKYRQDAQAAEQLKKQLESLHEARRKALADETRSRAEAKNLRAQREILKAQARAMGATASLKIPRNLLGTAKGNELSALISQIKAVDNQLKVTRGSFADAQNTVKNLRTEIAEVTRQYREAARAASQSGNNFTAAKNNAAQLKASYQQQLAALHRLRTSLSAARFNTSGFAASEQRLISEINRVNAALERQQNLLNAQSRSSQASQEMFNAYNNFQGALNTATQIAAPFKTATEKAVEFERVMSEVKALTQMDNIKAGRFDVVDREMAQLTAQAKDLGATTIYTSQQVGEAQAYIARTGWDTNKILASTPHFLKLAASGHMDLARTADIATNIMTGFGISADKAGHVADVLAYTTTHSNQNLEEMGEAMKYAAPVARMFGASLEETAAMTKFMADAGIKGSMAGTSMRQTMLRLVAPPKKATKAMQEMGLTVDDANAAWQNANAIAKEYGITMDESLTPGRQMLSIVKQIDQKMAGKSSHEKMAAFSAITGINAVSGALNLFEAGSDALDAFTTALENCDGALEQTYGVMTQNTYGALKSLESAWDAVQMSVGRAISPIVKSAAEAFTPLLTQFSKFVDEHPGIVQACAAIAGALATLVVGAAAVKLAFAGWKFIASSIQLVSTSLASLGSGALLGGLIGRLALLRTALFGLGGAATLGGWGAMFGAIGAKATAAATAVRTFFASLTLGSAATGIATTISSIGTAIAGAARAAFAFAFSPVGVALMALALAGMYCYQNWDRVAPVLSNIASIITGALSGAIYTVVSALAAMNASGSFDALIASASQLASVVGGALVKAFAVFLTVAASAIAIVLQLIGDVVKTIAELGGGIADALGKATSGDFSGAISALGDTASKTLSNIKDLGSHVFDGVEQGAKNVQQTLDALNMPKMPSAEAVSRHRGVTFDDSGVAHSAPAQAPQVDTSNAQANVDALGNAAQNAATNMDGVNQSAQGIQQAGEALAQFPASMQPMTDAMAQFPASLQPMTDAMTQFPASMQPMTDAMTQIPASMQPATDAMTQLGASAQNNATALAANSTSLAANGTALSANNTSLAANGTALGANSSALQANIGSLQAFGAACDGAISGVSALGSAASGAAGSVSGLGAAAQSACSQLAAAGANAAAAVSSAVASAGKPASNAEGGIYRKGTFLTTFAEKSPEAAIPLDRSKRAIDLWTRTGQILGTLPGQANEQYDAPNREKRGDIPEMPVSPRSPEPESRRPARLSARREKPPTPIIEQVEVPAANPVERIVQPIIEQVPLLKTAWTLFNGQIDLPKQEQSRTPRLPNLPRIMTQTQPQDYHVELPFDLGKIFQPQINLPTPAYQQPVPRRTDRRDRGRSQVPRTPRLPNLPRIMTQTQPQDYHVELPFDLGKIFQPQPQMQPRIEVNSPQLPSPIVTRNPKQPVAKLPNLPRIFTQTQPQPVSAGIPRGLSKIFSGGIFDNIGGIVGDIAGRIFSPQINLPEPQNNDGGLLGGLIDKVFAPPQDTEPITVNLTVNVTVNGNADEKTVQRGVEAALPAVEDWTRRLEDYRHEQRRRSYT